MHEEVGRGQLANMPVVTMSVGDADDAHASSRRGPYRTQRINTPGMTSERLSRDQKEAGALIPPHEPARRTERIEDRAEVCDGETEQPNFCPRSPRKRRKRTSRRHF